MLTPKQNMIECMKKDGHPDRFVNQYEAVQLLFHPFLMASPLLQRGQENVVNAWGVTNSFPENTPGAFPVHTPDKIVVQDIEHWRDYVKAPSLKFPQELWDAAKGMYAAVDFEGWTDENCEKVVRQVCDECGKQYFIPCIVQGGPGSVYPGVYMSLANAIDKVNEEQFGIKAAESTRLPWQVLF